MKNPISLIHVLVVMVFLSGCQSTGVIPMDQDSYMIAKKDGTPGLGVSYSNKAEVYQEANLFCSEKGLEVKTIEITTIPAAPARLGSTELIFKCVQPAVSVTPQISKPDSAIEVRNR